MTRRTISTRSPGRARRALTAAVASCGVVALTVGAVVVVLDHTRGQAAVRYECRATSIEGPWRLSPEQADNAALIVAVSVRRGMPMKAATIGLATALQESGLRNLDYGDRDSVGLFQQRTSQGWGSVDEIMDPLYSSNAFYDELENVEDYGSLPITEAAQAVQRSAFPDAYAQHQARALAWGAALTGLTQEAITCRLPPATPIDPRDPVVVDAGLSAVENRVTADFGALRTTRTGVAAVDVDVTSPATSAADTTRLSWAVAQWAVATSSTTQVASVRVAGQVWTRESNSWALDGTTDLPTGVVRLTLTTSA